LHSSIIVVVVVVVVVMCARLADRGLKEGKGRRDIILLYYGIISPGKLRYRIIGCADGTKAGEEFWTA